MLNRHFARLEQASIPFTAPITLTSPEIWVPPVSAALPANPVVGAVNKDVNAFIEAVNSQIKLEEGDLSQRCDRLVSNIGLQEGTGGPKALAELTQQLMQVRDYHDQAVNEMMNEVQRAQSGAQTRRRFSCWVRSSRRSMPMNMIENRGQGDDGDRCHGGGGDSSGSEAAASNGLEVALSPPIGEGWGEGSGSQLTYHPPLSINHSPVFTGQGS